MNTPQLIPIKKITQENSAVKTFWFDYPLKSQPGQFIMLWLPDVDQKPLSIAYDDGASFGVSVFPAGEMTKKLFEMKTGGRVGVSGPYGKQFSVKPNTRYITVSGGYGAGPLGLLAERLKNLDSEVDFCIGARTKDLLLFANRVARLPHAKVHIATDDGSAGHKGYVTQLLEQLLQENTKTRKHENILVAACGPEIMEKKVLDICNEYEVDCEISIERYIKCGFGVCGQCCVDDTGIPLCVNGPVVDRATANQITEFGKYHRDKSGQKQYY